MKTLNFLNKTFWLFVALSASTVVFNSCGDDGEPGGGTIDVTSISLNQPTLRLTVGGNETLRATILPANATDKTVTWTSSDNTKATVVNGTVTAVAVGTAIITAKAGTREASCIVTITAAPVVPADGVLINGVVWATRNVDEIGTFAATPESDGKFYQWNRKKAWNTTGVVTGWDSTCATGMAWERTNDPSPAGWRIPTWEEALTLCDASKVSSIWTTQNGVNGQKFTDKTTGASIFLPACDSRSGSHSNPDRDCGSYYTSTGIDYEVKDAFAYEISFTSWAPVNPFAQANRMFGRSIRSVAE